MHCCDHYVANCCVAEYVFTYMLTYINDTQQHLQITMQIYCVC